jgi:hypothetical protein
MQMRAQAVDYRYANTEHRDSVQAATAERVDSLMTPARRAGLDALERELSEFLKARTVATGAIGRLAGAP